jgi:peptidoglycan hydrolase-like protein with peptidoglycan-binding domain
MSDVLKQGSKGDDVKALQAKLAKLGFAVEADGQFGPKTDSVVKELQTLFGYDVDGKVGPGTTGLIDKQITNAWKATDPKSIKRALEGQGKKTAKGNLAGVDAKRTLKSGDSGPDVSALQRRLNALGYAIAVSGAFDAGTEKAVKDLQAKFGYDVDGIVGAGTHTLVNAQIGHEWDVTKAGAGRDEKVTKKLTKEGVAKVAKAVEGAKK